MNNDNKNHIYGKFESMKFDHRRKNYAEYTDYLEKSNVTKKELIENIGAYIGDMSLNRLMTLCAYFDMTQNIAGHIADVGTYKGGSALLFAKLMKIHNPESTWQVHGFDWFKGTPSASENDSMLVPEGGYLSSEEELRKLTNLQNLDPIFRLHNLNIISELDKFFNDLPHLQFRLVFMDAGLYDVMDKAIPLFWSRLITGGIMVFDQLSHEFAPGEISAVRKHLPNEVINTLPNSWMPNAFIRKQKE
jgi:predicted O-methyltransferase YrrM